MKRGVPRGWGAGMAESGWWEGSFIFRKVSLIVRAHSIKLRKCGCATLLPIESLMQITIATGLRLKVFADVFNHF